MPTYNNTSNIVTSGLGFPQNIITQGFYAPDYRIPLYEVNNAFILQGMASPNTQDLIVKGFNASFGDIFPKKSLYFDSIINTIEEFDSPLINKDRIIRKYNMWF